MKIWVGVEAFDGEGWLQFGDENAEPLRATLFSNGDGLNIMVDIQDAPELMERLEKHLERAKVWFPEEDDDETQ